MKSEMRLIKDKQEEMFDMMRSFINKGPQKQLSLKKSIKEKGVDKSPKKRNELR